MFQSHNRSNGAIHSMQQVQSGDQPAVSFTSFRRNSPWHWRQYLTLFGLRLLPENERSAYLGEELRRYYIHYKRLSNYYKREPTIVELERSVGRKKKTKGLGATWAVNRLRLAGLVPLHTPGVPYVPDHTDHAALYGYALDLLQQWAKQYPKSKLALQSLQLVKESQLTKLDGVRALEVPEYFQDGGER